MKDMALCRKMSVAWAGWQISRIFYSSGRGRKAVGCKWYSPARILWAEIQIWRWQCKSVAYLNKAINECNKNLSEKHNVIKKAEILIKLERYNEAKDALGAYLHNNDDDEVKMLLENFNMLKDEILQGEQLLYEKIALLTRWKNSKVENDWFSKNAI